MVPFGDESVEGDGVCWPMRCARSVAWDSGRGSTTVEVDYVVRSRQVQAEAASLEANQERFIRACLKRVRPPPRAASACTSRRGTESSRRSIRTRCRKLQNVDELAEDERAVA